MDILYVRLSEIKSYERNAKKHPPEQVERIAKSLQEFGWKQPLVIDRNNVIVTGHWRYLAAKSIGEKTVPCIRADDLTDEQIQAYRLIDNKVSESEWDEDLLNIELDEIFDIDMERFGFDLSEFEEQPEVVEDDFEPVVPDEPKAKPGDIYQLGRHYLMCGDSTSIDDVKKLMDGQTVSMPLTDPPYNVDYHGTAGTIQNDKMQDENFRIFLRDAFRTAKTVMKPGAVFHVWHAETQGYNFRGALKDVGFTCRQQLIWVKSSQTLGRQDFQRMYEGVLTGDNFDDEEMAERGYEACLYGWKDGAGHKWYKKRKEKDVLFFDKPRASAEHPTMKPILLFDYEMQCNTKKGDAVLDLFAGSGTTIMAAEQNGRIAYCMELDPRFVDVIINRWEEFTGEEAKKL